MQFVCFSENTAAVWGHGVLACFSALRIRKIPPVGLRLLTSTVVCWVMWPVEWNDPDLTCIFRALYGPCWIHVQQANSTYLSRLCKMPWLFAEMPYDETGKNACYSLLTLTLFVFRFYTLASLYGSNLQPNPSFLMNIQNYFEFYIELNAGTNLLNASLSWWSWIC